MKKLLSLLLIGGFTFGANAQDSDDNKFKVGLVTGGEFTILKTQTNEIEGAGAGAGFTIGVGFDYMFNSNVGISSGLQFDIEKFRVNYGDAVTATTPSGDVFYGYEDTEIKKFDDQTNYFEDLSDTSAILELTNRTFKPKYLSIPIFLKFQTNKIGQFIYYGKFGLRTSILLGVRFDDEGYDAAYDSGSNSFVRTGSATHTLNQDMKPETIIKGLNPIRMGIGMYGGAQWNFTGNTYLFMEAGFNYGIIPSMQKVSGHLVNQTNDGMGTIEREQLDIKNNPQHVIEIKVGLLF